jgi:protein transport protein SEC61 subunit gamma and related proteins
MAIKEKLTSFLGQCVRVWHLLRKPTREEFQNVSKVSAIGLGLIGLLGFIIAVIMAFVYPK